MNEGLCGGKIYSLHSYHCACAVAGPQTSPQGVTQRTSLHLVVCMHVIAGARLQAPKSSLRVSTMHLPSRDFIPRTFSLPHSIDCVGQFKMPPIRSKKRTASESLANDNSGTPASKKTGREGTLKTNHHQPACRSGIRAQQVPGALQGSDVLKRTLQSHLVQLRSTTSQDVSADPTLTQLERQNETINALRLLGQHKRHGIFINFPPHRPVVSLPAKVECTVNGLFTRKAISGRQWKCEVEEFTASKTKFGCAIYWPVDESTNERRWSGATLLSE